MLIPRLTLIKKEKNEEKEENIINVPRNTIPVPKIIHIVWFGKKFKDEYNCKVREWGGINEKNNYKVCLWIDKMTFCDGEFDEAKYNEMQNEWLKYGATLVDYRELHGISNSHLLEAELNPQTGNYGASSDIFRIE